MITCRFEDSPRDAALRHVTSDTVVADDQNRVLLVKRAEHLFEGGKYALPGGYLDRDELAQDAARREVLEETGYECSEIQLLGITSSPKRPGNDRQDVAFFFFTTALSQIQDPDHESTAVEWFDLDHLPSREQLAFDHLDFIEIYKQYKNDEIAVPVIL